MDIVQKYLRANGSMSISGPFRRRLALVVAGTIMPTVAIPRTHEQVPSTGSHESRFASSSQRLAAAQLAETFASSWNSRDGDAYGDAYWPDAELVDPSGQVWNGRVAIIQTHRDLWAGPARATQMTAVVRRVLALSPTLFVVDIDTSATGFFPPPPGAPNGVVETRLKHVVERRHGQWKIIRSQNTFLSHR